jgi:hypothetical protein
MGDIYYRAQKVYLWLRENGEDSDMIHIAMKIHKPKRTLRVSLPLLNSLQSTLPAMGPT